MPAMTPVLASGPPSSRARIRLRLGPIDVAQDAENVDLELLELGAREDGSADADHARTHLVERQRPGLGAGRGDKRSNGETGESETAFVHCKCWMGTDLHPLYEVPREAAGQA